MELGCCFGFLSLRLARAGNPVTAVDLAPGTVGLLASVAPVLGTKLCALVGDASAVPLADGSADTVLAVHLLEHLPPAIAPCVLAEMLRVARRRVIVAVPFEDPPNPTWGHVRTFDLAVNVFANEVILPPIITETRPNDTNNFQPRFGFAYTLTDRTVLRGGDRRPYPRS